MPQKGSYCYLFSPPSSYFNSVYFKKDRTPSQHMSICEVLIVPDLLQSLEHFQNTGERGKEVHMGSCSVKQDFHQMNKQESSHPKEQKYHS